jgi:membrane protein
MDVWSARLQRVRPWLRAGREAVLGDAPVNAAGVALFALLAALPSLGAVVAIYALISDPGEIGAELAGLDRVLPDELVEFMVAQLSREAARSDRHLGIALITTIALALWSGRATADALIVGLNRAYGVTESRHPLDTFLLSGAVAAVTLVGLFVIVAVVIALPSVLELLRVRGDVDTVATWIRWPLLLVTVKGGLVALYRTAPSPRPLPRRRLVPGATSATILWLAVSIGLSLWVEHVADYQSLYGAFSGALVFILWLYISALAILLGGVINAELERADATREP